MAGERASCPIDNVAVGFPDVSETFYAIIPTARDHRWIPGQVGDAGPVCGRHADPCESTYGGLMYSNEMRRKDVCAVSTHQGEGVKSTPGTY